MPNIFLDCGFYDGIALKKYIDAGIITKDWLIFVFEPRPDFDIQPRIDRLGVDIKLVKKAVWTDDTEVLFDNGIHDNAGYIASVRDDVPHESTATVEAIDFSKFVTGLPDVYIICSMDIEGSEFPVLEKMLKDGSMTKINLLDIEFHHRLLLKRTADTSRSLIDKLLARGVGVKLKVPLE